MKRSIKSDSSNAPPSHNAKRRATLATLTGLPLVIAACTTKGNWIEPPVGLPSTPVARSGERWRYQRINRYNDEPLGEILAEVVQVEPELRVRLTDNQGQIWGEEIYTQPWQILQEPLYNETLRFADAVPLIPEQLAVGASSAIKTAYQVGTQSGSKAAMRSWHSEIKAIGWERISVPAGQFESLRVARTTYFEPSQMGRFNARRVETLWYAPAVNRWVQREWTGFYLDESSLPDNRKFLHVEDREDSVKWVLLEHQSAPVAR